MQRAGQREGEGLLRAQHSGALRLLYLKARAPAGALCYKPTSQGRDKQQGVEQARQGDSWAEQERPGMLVSQLGQAAPGRAEHAVSREKLVWGAQPVSEMTKPGAFSARPISGAQGMERKQAQPRDPAPWSSQH